jgi:hypothetical protein
MLTADAALANNFFLKRKLLSRAPLEGIRSLLGRLHLASRGVHELRDVFRSAGIVRD